MAGCTRKKICINFDKSDVSSFQNCTVHSRYPSASNCKVYETNKPRKVALPTREMRSDYLLRKNIWEYLNEDKKAGKFTCSSKRRTRLRCKQVAGNAVENNKIWLVFMLLLIGILTLTYSRLSEFIAQSKFITKVVPKARLISLLNTQPTVEEECCYVKKKLAASLLRAEHNLRNTHRIRRLMIITSRTSKSAYASRLAPLLSMFTSDNGNHEELRELLKNSRETYSDFSIFGNKSSVCIQKVAFGVQKLMKKTTDGHPKLLVFHDAVSWQNERDHIQDATVMRGSGTREWGSRVALWGLLPLWRVSPPPSTVLVTRTPVPSDCWPFSGSRGEMVIELKQETEIRSISIEHVRPDTAKSAPKNFVLYGILDNGTLVEYVEADYRNQGPAKQYFEVTVRNTSVHKMIFRVLSNQGNPKYTCVYRIHLYGNGTKTKSTLISDS